WKSYTSLLSPTAIFYASNGHIYASTQGGILDLELSGNTFDFITDEDGLDYLDLKSLSATAADTLWVGGNMPRGTLQVYSADKGLLTDIDHLDIDIIHKILPSYPKAYAVYQDAQEWGLLEFLINDRGLPEFQDHFHSFPQQIDEILDVDLGPDSIYIVIQNGVLAADKSSILNFSTSWHYAYQDDAGYAQQVAVDGDIYLITKNRVYVKNPGGAWDLDNPLISHWFGRVLDVELSAVNNRLGLLAIRIENDTNISAYFEYDLQGNLLFEFDVPIETEFTCMSRYENEIAFGLKNHGIMRVDVSDPGMPVWQINVPNTLMFNTFHALTVTAQGDLAGIGNESGWMGDHSRNIGGFVYRNGIWDHFIPADWSYGYPPTGLPDDNFHATVLNYLGGAKQPWSIVESNQGNLLFSNDGIVPSEPGVRGGVIEVNPETWDFFVYDTTDGLLDGLAGVYNHSWNSRYLSINQINKDRQGNVWVLNPYSEVYNHIAAVQLPDGQTWTHVPAMDEISYLPQEVAFDSHSRAWFGFLQFETMTTDEPFSSGGLKVFSYFFDLQNTANNTWNGVDFEVDPPGVNVYSLTFDKQDLLWILTNGGVQGYSVGFSGNRFSLTPVFPLNFFAYIPFNAGDKIRVDAQNNKWITTQHSGVRVIRENTTFWPDEEGFTAENSGLLSDIVYDIAFDDEAGLAYLSTAKGISSIRLPYQAVPDNESDLKLSPNPFRIPADDYVVIRGCRPGSVIKIMTLTGKVVVELSAENSGLETSQAEWNGRNSRGELVGSGVYLVTSSHPEGNKAVGKLAVIRQ
ncbi:MAG: hypothetical protein GXO91_10560, partial [FCB group bacterium]|nr:hypothetical protein [FCB group bacterium]